MLAGGFWAITDDVQRLVLAPIERMMNMVDEGMYQQECTLSTHPINTLYDTPYDTHYYTHYQHTLSTHPMTHPTERMMNMVDEGMFQQECILSTHPITHPIKTSYQHTLLHTLSIHSINPTYDTHYDTPDRAYDEHGG